MAPRRRHPDRSRLTVDEDGRIADAVVTPLGIVAHVHDDPHWLPRLPTVRAARHADVDVSRQVAPASPPDIVDADQRPLLCRGEARNPVRVRAVVARFSHGIADPQPVRWPLLDTLLQNVRADSQLFAADIDAARRASSFFELNGNDKSIQPGLECSLSRDLHQSTGFCLLTERGEFPSDAAERLDVSDVAERRRTVEHKEDLVAGQRLQVAFGLDDDLQHRVLLVSNEHRQSRLPRCQRNNFHRRCFYEPQIVDHHAAVFRSRAGEAEFLGHGLAQLQRQVIFERADDGFLRVVVQRLPLAFDECLDTEVVRHALRPALVPEVELIEPAGLLHRRPDDLPLFAAEQPQALFSGSLMLGVNGPVTFRGRPLAGFVPLSQQWSRLEVFETGRRRRRGFGTE